MKIYAVNGSSSWRGERGSNMAKQREIKKTVCTFCTSNCGMLVHVKDGKIVNIEPNREHPLSRGFTCERNRLALKWLYHPDQLM
ncbi:MAG: hypothetical protein E3J24_04530, partial [Dehalococcoidia bacterium]